MTIKSRDLAVSNHRLRRKVGSLQLVLQEQRRECLRGSGQLALDGKRICPQLLRKSEGFLNALDNIFALDSVSASMMMRLTHLVLVALQHVHDELL